MYVRVSPPSVLLLRLVCHDDLDGTPVMMLLPDDPISYSANSTIRIVTITS
jgi:hypothetical protein